MRRYGGDSARTCLLSGEGRELAASIRADKVRRWLTPGVAIPAGPKAGREARADGLRLFVRFSPVQSGSGPLLAGQPVACGSRASDGFPCCAMNRLRKGFKIKRASSAAVKSRMAAIRKTSFQLPVSAGSKLASGITRAAVPLAV